MNLPNAHQTLFNKTAKLAHELKGIEANVKQQEQALFSKIGQLSRALSQASQQKQPAPIKTALAANFSQAGALLDAWKNKVEQHETNLSFREKFGDSLLVYVYGKVKSGKSSLGNYIACGTANPSQELMQKLATAGHKPTYFLHDQNQGFTENINHLEGFRVGELETTSCIQGFSLPGLTWVDSPGLHSVNAKNGNLAKKYIKSADLVIYLMHADNVSRETDLQELTELLKAGKRILILLTQCDKNEQDEIDGEIVKTKSMFSDEDRQQIEQYSLDRIEELRQSLNLTEVDISVLSLSVDYAQLHQDDPQALIDSGVSALFKQLEQLLYSEGLALKKQVPTNNLQAFYRTLLAQDSSISIHQLNTPLSEAIAKMHTQQDEIAKLSERTESKVQLAYAQQVDTLVEKYAANKDTQALQQAAYEYIQQSIVGEYQKPLGELLEASFNALTTAIQNQRIEGLVFANHYHEINVDVSGKGIAIGSGAGAILGAVAGFFIAGPPGALIGSAAGGAAGGAIGGAYNPTEMRSIHVGDNREDVKETLLAYGQKAIQEQFEHIQAEVNLSLLEPLLNTLTGLNNDTQKLEQYIEEQTHV